MWFIALLFGLGVAASQGYVDVGVGVVDVVECNDVIRTCNDERDIRDRDLNRGDRFDLPEPTEPPVGDDDDDNDDDDDDDDNNDDNGGWEPGDGRPPWAGERGRGRNG